MLSREEYIKRTTQAIAYLQTEIRLRGYLNLYDCHIIAEDFMANLLNIVFDYQLINLNYFHKNQPGIDLGDQSNSIAFQVTAQKSKIKIQKTINKFIDEELYKEYRQLYFFILQEKYEPRSTFDTKGYFVFDNQENILDFGDLIREIRGLKIEKLKETVEFLDKEISLPSQGSGPDESLLVSLLSELPAIKELDYYHPNFQTWHNTVKQTLRRFFGEDSYQVKEYDKIVWHTSDNPEKADEQRNLYFKSCIAAEGQLNAAVAASKSENSMVKSIVTDATVEFSYKYITADYDIDEHLYQLLVAVKNEGKRVINDFKLEFTFPDLKLIPRRWTIIASRAFHIKEEAEDKQLVEIESSRDFVSINRQGYMIQVAYRSTSKLFPGETIDLTKDIGLKYRVNRSIFSNLEVIPPIEWTLYADEMPRKQGNISLSKLNEY